MRAFLSLFYLTSGKVPSSSMIDNMNKAVVSVISNSVQMEDEGAWLQFFIGHIF